MLSYMHSKKMPQVFWMIKQVTIALEKKKYVIKIENEKSESFSIYHIILFYVKVLINKYIESNDMLFENYLQFLFFFQNKNENMIDYDMFEKIKKMQLLSERRELPLIDSTVWKHVNFYSMVKLYNIGVSEKEKDLFHEISNRINITDDIDTLIREEFDFCILDVGGGKGDLGISLSLAFKKKVLIIILDININSLFSCFIKMYCNNITNVLILNESILHFDFKKFKIDLVVGLHCCGGLTDFVLAKCLKHEIDFLICSCCYTKYKNMRKCLFDLRDKTIVDELSHYIYGEEKCRHIVKQEKKHKQEELISSLKENEETLLSNIKTCTNDLQINSKYDKYEKKVLRRTIPTLHSFINLLAKLCESDNKIISFKCMHFYNALRFLILKKKFKEIKNDCHNNNNNSNNNNSNNNTNDNSNRHDSFQFFLHSFPASFSPKNLVLKGSFK